MKSRELQKFHQTIGEDIQDDGPHNHPQSNWVNYGGDNNHVSYYETDYYVSTPFTGSSLLGCDFRLVKNLNFNISAGYGLKVMKIRYKIWGGKEIEPDSDLSGKYNMTNGKLLHFIDIKFGLTYAFPVKKK